MSFSAPVFFKRLPWGIALGVLLFVGVRVWHLLAGGAVIDADEAVVGLMARHILQGEHVIYYWGEDYMGSLEAYTAALFFRFLPPTSFVLKLAPFLHAALLLGLLFWMVRRLFPGTASRYLLFFAAVPPPFILVWTLKARGGYIGTLLLGTALFAIVCKWIEVSERFPFTPRPSVAWRRRLGRVCTFALALSAAMVLAQVVFGGFAFRVFGLRVGNSSYTKPVVAILVFLPLHLVLAGRAPGSARLLHPATFWAVGFGMVAGLSWWTNALVVFFWAPALAAIAWFLRRLLTDPAGQLTALPPVGAGFLLGSLPMWFHASAAVPDGSGDALVEGELWQLQFTRFFTVGLPRFLGVRWHPAHGFGGITDGLLAGFAVAVVLFGVFSFFTAALRREPAPRQALRLMAVLLVLLFPWLFALSEFGGFVQEPRYFLPLHAGLVLLAAMLFASLHRWKPVAGVLLCAGILFAHGHRIRVFDFVSAQPYVQARRAPLDLSPVYAYMEEKGIEAAYANYWLAYRMTFETRERIIVTPHPRGRNDRRPAYTEWVDAHPNPAYVFMDSIAGGMANYLERRGVARYETKRFPPVVVVHDLYPVPDPADR